MLLISCCLPFPRELVDSLHQRNMKVFLISGGFRCIVEHVAAQLNIPQHHVYANRLKFYFNGERWNGKNHSCNLQNGLCCFNATKELHAMWHNPWIHKYSAHADARVCDNNCANGLMISTSALFTARRVCRLRREPAHSREWWQRKGHQQFEGAVRLQDSGDDRRRRHWPGGVSSRCKRSGFEWLRCVPGNRGWKAAATLLCLCHWQSAFIGFGGNVVRQQVKERCSWYVTGFGELIEELEKI